ncbi:GLPGLI family protein [Prevotellaceae bacterium KH2P17]|nr:GLPGLI family protein [Prevotellaceae bacterium KH2P17]
MYNKFFLFTLLATLSTNVQGQEVDSVRMRAYYLYSFKSYTDQKDLKTEEKVLEIGQHRTAYYGRWQKRREEIADSVTKAHGSVQEALRLIGQYPTPRSFEYVFNNYPIQGQRTIADREYKSFYYKEPIAPITWTIQPRDTTILNMPCQFATCTYGNRKWTACFTSSIPVQAGPWKLQGLPGLILYAHDDSGIFSFECFEIRQGEGTVSIPSLDKSIKCTKQELKRLKEESAANPVEYVKRFGIIDHPIGRDGKPIVYKKRIPVFLEN